MLDSTIINTLVPVFAVIAVGYFVTYYEWLERGFWNGAEKLAYYLLLPTILFIKIADSDFSNALNIIPIASVVLVANLIIFIIVFVWYHLHHPQKADFTALMQGSIQTNAAYIGLPVALGIFGQKGLVIYAMLLGVVVPVMNTFVLSFLIYYDPSKVKEPLLAFLKRVLLHPIVIACLGGLFVSYLNVDIPTIIYKTLSSLSSAALPIGLLVVGSALNIKAVRSGKYFIGVATFIKLILLPVVAIWIARWFELSAFDAGIAVVYTILPASAASYLMAKRHGSNASLLAGMIVAQTVAASVTIPIALAIMDYIFTLPL